MMLKKMVSHYPASTALTRINNKKEKRKRNYNALEQDKNTCGYYINFPLGILL